MKLIVAIILSLSFLEPTNVSVEKWVIEKASSLRIEGKTNVNNFACSITEYLNQDTILLYRDNPHEKSTIKGGLSININRFDCEQNYITTDFKKTLKADKNACMKINLLSLEHIKPNTPNQTVTGYVEIQLAGISKKIEIDYLVLKNQSGILHLKGSKKLSFSDFKLIPPKKLAGLIRVEQEIQVQFHLMLRAVSARSGM